ncbi:MAG: hypothetical protein HYR72_25020 [Deltaproteobacteria bacterium]|nr:hypothetical protein [Deltaproteobacteria bacterium]MBI3388526.1 hypothetical protein [Deltaproteobacteria bacterium]
MRKHVASVLTVLGCVLIGAASVRADDAALLDVLRQKQVLTPQEYERLKGSELTPAQRAGLIDVLRDKGVLTKDEAAKLEPGAPVAPNAPTVAQAAAKPASLPQVGYDEGFFVRSQDGNFNLRFNGRVSSNFYFFEPNTSQVDTETIDRARLSADATFYKYFRMRLENDFAFASGLRDAFIAMTPMPEANVQIGQYKIPFSYEELLSKRYIDFVERAAVVNSTVGSTNDPSRDIGVMLYGQFVNKTLQYQLAGMNGAGQNRSDNNASKDVDFRTVVAPFTSAGPEHLRSLNVGAGVTYGVQPSDTGTSTSSIAGTTETGFTFYPAVQRNGERSRYDVSGTWFDGPFSLSSEYIQTYESRNGFGVKGSNLPGLHTDGAYVGGTWLLTGETKPYNARLHPAHALWDTNSPGWGAWEAALRYEYFKLRHGGGILANGTANPALDNRYDALVAGVNWYPNEFLRFSVNYLYGSFENAGKNMSPNPAQHSNNAVLGRAQLEF